MSDGHRQIDPYELGHTFDVLLVRLVRGRLAEGPGGGSQPLVHQGGQRAHHPLAQQLDGHQRAVERRDHRAETEDDLPLGISNSRLKVELSALPVIGSRHHQLCAGLLDQRMDPASDRAGGGRSQLGQPTPSDHDVQQAGLGQALGNPIGGHRPQVGQCRVSRLVLVQRDHDPVGRGGTTAFREHQGHHQRNSDHRTTH